MKTAISIPDDLFEEADRLARRLKKSRSEVYSRAVREYVARHSDDEVTEALDLVCEETEACDEFAVRAGAETLRRSEW